ncbi:hypothetical protein DPMN_139970 [Dreissena polymorpha]|uniref:Uncharacterized protein n=1 Tax=Dreissena polymorpha TaxID=45954 RepID=A0A9D4GAL4_DREPO|nr:hypothetical protein DPMN_139970 [Dreissena polymorpha]
MMEEEYAGLSSAAMQEQGPRFKETFDEIMSRGPIQAIFGDNKVSLIYLDDGSVVGFQHSQIAAIRWSLSNFNIIRTNDLTKFLEGCTVNVISRVENCYALNGHGFKPTEHF